MADAEAQGAAAAPQPAAPGSSAATAAGGEQRAGAQPARVTRMRYGWVWMVFLASMFVGAGLIVAGRAALGATVLLLPVVASVLLSLAYYLLERSRQA